MTFVYSPAGSTPALWAIGENTSGIPIVGLWVNTGSWPRLLGRVTHAPVGACVPSEDWTFGPGALSPSLPWSGCRASPSTDKGEQRDDGTAAAAAADGDGG